MRGNKGNMGAEANKRIAGIELLRIISMLMVLCLHANYPALGAGKLTTLPGIVRFFAELGCIVAVDVFVMISGWFGIRASVRGFLKFMWQVFYFMVLAIAVEWRLGLIPITSETLLSTIGLYEGGGWFVVSYLGLYVLSPILNSFIAQSSRKQCVMVLAAFFSFEFLYGMVGDTVFINRGYSAFSFIGLYILAGTLRKLDFHCRRRRWLVLYVVTVLMNSAFYVVTRLAGLSSISGESLNYVNPMVVAGAACLLLAFKDSVSYGRKLDSVIRFVASSSFAVYLLHVGTDAAYGFYCDTVRNLVCSPHHGMIVGALMGGGFVLGVYCIAIALDIPRKMAWNAFSDRCRRKRQRMMEVAR